MNLRWITLFATVAEEGSFTRAATKLNIAQPWLSAQLRKLEYELGIDLLIRENVGVKVTPAGQQLLPHARQLAEAAVLFRETARSLGEDRSRAVKLGCYVPIIDMPAIKALTMQFGERYGSFDLNTLTGNPSSLLKALEECRIDLALMPAEGLEDRPELQSISLGKMAVFVLVLRDSKFKRLEDLKGVSVGLPPEDVMPSLREGLAAKFEALEIETSEIPEFDRRAIEHSVTTRRASVAIAIDESALQTLDPVILAIPVEGIRVEHRLYRTDGRDLGRAAERFWANCVQAFGTAAV